MSTKQRQATKQAVEQEMKSAEVISIAGLARTEIQAVCGQLWVSVEGRNEDIILCQGEELALAPSGKVVVEALRDSRVRFRFP